MALHDHAPAERKRIQKNLKRRRKTLGAKIHPDSKGGRTVASVARSAAYFKLEAGRRATAKRLSGQKATTQAQLRARQPKPPAKPQGGLGGMIESIMGGQKRLEDALKLKPGKKQ